MRTTVKEQGFSFSWDPPDDAVASAALSLLLSLPHLQLFPMRQGLEK
jgi:hypothetical protein